MSTRKKSSASGMKICGFCGKSFITTRTTRGQQLCSVACRSGSHRESRHKTRVSQVPILADAAYLRTLIHEQQLSTWKAAKTIGCCLDTLLSALAYHNIPILKNKQIVIPKNCIVCGEPFHSLQGALTCGHACGASLGHVKSGPRKHTTNENASANATTQWDRQRRAQYPLLYDEAWLHQKYMVEELSQPEIGALVGCSRMPVATMLRRFGFQRSGHTERTRLKCSGSNNWNWKGGVYNKHVLGWSEGRHIRMKMRKALIVKRGTRCEGCGKQLSGRAITVHHIVPFQYSRSHADSNVLIMCSQCHSRADHLFLHKAAEYYVSSGCPGWSEVAGTLKLPESTATG